MVGEVASWCGGVEVGGVVSPERYEECVRVLLGRLVPVVEGFPRLCAEFPCRNFTLRHQHLVLPESVSSGMGWAADAAFELFVLGWDLGVTAFAFPGEGHAVWELGEVQRAVEGWVAVGLL